MTENKLATIDEIIESFKLGELIILVDDEDRENEGDLIVAADVLNPEHINFMIKEIALHALNNKKHVLSEKPLGKNSIESKKMQKCAMKN